MHRSRTAPPRARLAGGIYLLYFVAAFTVLGLSTTHHHAAARALNILDNLLYIALTLLLYFIFRHAGPRLAAAAVAFSLLGCAGNVLGPFHLCSVHLHPLLFFALFMVLLGTLIVRSALLPAAIDYGLMLAAIAWACLPFAGLPAPPAGLC